MQIHNLVQITHVLPKPLRIGKSSVTMDSFLLKISKRQLHASERSLILVVEILYTKF